MFDYFDELRGKIEMARADLLFVDPYLDADFVARYLQYVNSAAKVRLLCSKGVHALITAVDLFGEQVGLNIQVRSSTSLHDRYLFVDRSRCFLSGASFKDGAARSPTVIAEVTDAFAPCCKCMRTFGKQARSNDDTKELDGRA